MEKKIIQYGTTYKVKVLNASKLLITVHAEDINEGFFLIGHGVKNLPKENDKGKIVFERGGPNNGYWRWYPEKKN